MGAVPGQRPSWPAPQARRGVAMPVREDDANLRDSWLPVAEAAARLGVSERTVQKRAREGKLPCRRDGRRLLVRVCGDDVREESRRVREPDANDGGALVRQLREENAFLRAQLEERTRAEAELRRLLAVHMLPPAPTDQDTDPSRQPAPARRAWWRIWR